MSYKIIVIYTSLLLVLGTLAGIPFGIWLAKDELISNLTIFHLGMYMTVFVAELIIFYFLYMQKLSKPTLHALIIGILYLVISYTLLYVLIDTKHTPLLAVIDAMIIVLAIYLSLYIAKIRGKLSVRA